MLTKIILFGIFLLDEYDPIYYYILPMDYERHGSTILKLLSCESIAIMALLSFILF